MYPPNHQSVHQKQRVSSQVIQSYILEWGYHDASKLWNVKVTAISESERCEVSFIHLLVKQKTTTEFDTS